MALEFPANPTQGQKYIGENGVEYTWTGQYWAAEDAAARYVETSGDTMTGDLTMSSASIVFKVDDVTTIDLNGNTGDITLTGDVQSVSQNSGPLAGFRNAVMNCNGEVNQRGNGVATTNESYGPDRWAMFSNGTGLLDSAVTDPADVIAGVPSTFITIGNNIIGSGDNYELRQGIEDWVPLMGRKVTLSWFDKSDNAYMGAVNLRYSSNGVEAGQLNEFGLVSVVKANWKNLGTFGTWTRYSATFDLPELSEANYTTVSTSQGGCLVVGFASETTVSSTLSGRFTGIQLEVGAVASELEQIPYATQLSNCQRYYYQTDFYVQGNAPGPTVDGNGDPISGGTVSTWMTYPSTMRISTVGRKTITTTTQVPSDITAPQVYGNSQTGARITLLNDTDPSVELTDMYASGVLAVNCDF